LETIGLKSVSKSPADRYATAQQFADDLHRFLDNRPILARRPTLAQRARKWAQRHPSVVVACVVLLVLVTVGSLVSALLIGEEQGKTQAAYERLQAEEQKTKAEYRRAQERTAEVEEQFRLARKSVDEMIELSEELVGLPAMEGLRKRLLESALDYYQVFIAKHGNDPGAVADLVVTQERVRKILDDLAVLQSAGQFRHLKDPPVRDELRASDEQRTLIDKMLQDQE